MARKSQLLGQVFEKSIESAVRNTGLMLIKIDPVKVGRHNVKSKWLDYLGWLDGRTFTFDAKWIGDENTFQRSRLSKVQQGYLDEAHATGALSFVLVGYVMEGRPAKACIPWSAMPQRGSVPVRDYIVDDWTNWVMEALR